MVTAADAPDYASPQPRDRASPQPQGRASPEPQGRASPQPQDRASLEPQDHASPQPRDRASPDTQDRASLDALLNLLRGRRVAVLAGAGCSTESGIPDYRGPDSARRRRTPVQYQDFLRSEEARVRYWARSAIGWPRMAASRPNRAHYALARLEDAGAVRGIITQNVDGLHHAAGGRRVVELHGSLALVRCLGCARSLPRSEYQDRLLRLNAEWADWLALASRPSDLSTAPDGDADLPVQALRGFRVPGCGSCAGIMKPDVVFFGENVPPRRVERAWRLFGEAEVLLVVGSSLAVYSGRRFVYRAQKERVPIGIINLGPTRADEVAAVKVERRLGRVLPELAEALLHARAAEPVSPLGRFV